MAELRNVRNTGVVVGGNVSGSTISVGAAGSPSEVAVFQRLSELLGSLPDRAEELPDDQAVEVAAEAMRLKKQLAAPERDSGRIRATLGKLVSVAGAAAPVAEVIKEIADLVTSVVH